MKLDIKPPNCLKKILCPKRKETYKKNLKRFALFFAKTIDFIADPDHAKPEEEGGTEIPFELFSVGQMLSSKIKHSQSDEFTYILRHVNGLKMTEKYDIAL